MALKIKLTRIGRKNNPKYRIVVKEGRSKRDGRYLEKIGFYDPLPEEAIINIDKERLQYWLSKGAQFTKGTYRLLSGFAK